MRRFEISGTIAAVAAAQELAYIQPATDETIAIVATDVGGEGLQTVDTWQLLWQRTSAVGPMVGAQSPVPRPLDPGIPAAAGTFRLDITTPPTVVALDYHWNRGVTNLGQGYKERRDLAGAIWLPGSGVGAMLDLVQKGTADAVDIVINIEIYIIG